MQWPIQVNFATVQHTLKNEGMHPHKRDTIDTFKIMGHARMPSLHADQRCAAQDLRKAFTSRARCNCMEDVWLLKLSPSDMSAAGFRTAMNRCTTAVLPAPESPTSRHARLLPAALE